jgi:hypothetical protein
VKLRLARERIPVTVGSLVIEMAGPARVKRLLRARNAKPVFTARKTIGAVELLNYGDDSRIKPSDSDPQTLSIKSETDVNPQNVWMLKPLKLISCGMP